VACRCPTPRSRGSSAVAQDPSSSLGEQRSSSSKGSVLAATNRGREHQRWCRANIRSAVTRCVSVCACPTRRNRQAGRDY